MVVGPSWRSWGRVLLRARRINPAEVARDGAWLVLAPHPDDETLGAGGLISALSAMGGKVAVAYLTDGSGSHRGAAGWSRTRIANVRAKEAGAALRLLGSPDPPIKLRWRDAAPFASDSPEFERTIRQLVAFCRRQQIRRIVSSWAADPHCDHEAAALLAVAVGRKLGVTPLYYSVWGWTIADLQDRLRGVRAIAVPVAKWRGRSRRALDQHRTQLGGRISGAVDRFVLPRSMRRLVDATHALLLEPKYEA